eukprot:scaffold16846_cov71-Cylindrotheca_fusiformis.AAC.1
MDSADWLSANVQLSIESLVRLLSTIHVVVRFCDNPRIPTMSEWLIQEICPFLEAVQQKTASSPAQYPVLPKW